MSRNFFPTPAKARILLKRPLTYLETQVLTGHSYLNDFQKKIGNTKDAGCRCGAHEETILHFLNECPTYSTERHDYIDACELYCHTFPLPLEMVTSNEIVWRELMNFVKKTKRLEKPKKGRD